MDTSTLNKLEYTYHPIKRLQLQYPQNTCQKQNEYPPQYVIYCTRMQIMGSMATLWRASTLGQGICSHGILWVSMQNFYRSYDASTQNALDWFYGPQSFWLTRRKMRLTLGNPPPNDIFTGLIKEFMTKLNKVDVIASNIAIIWTPMCVCAM